MQGHLSHYVKIRRVFESFPKIGGYFSRLPIKKLGYTLILLGMALFGRGSCTKGGLICQIIRHTESGGA
jgi:hypothetical protein